MSPDTELTNGAQTFIFNLAEQPRHQTG